MDQRQRYDIHGYGYPVSGIQRYKSDDSLFEYRPYNLTESREFHEHRPMVPPLIYANKGNCTEGRFPDGEVPFNLIHNPYFPISPETFDKHYNYSGNTSPQSIPSGYGFTVWTFQQKPQRSSQERGMSDPVQANSGANLYPGQRDSDPISLHGSSYTNWSPMETPEDMSVPFERASNTPYPASSRICANCRNHPHGDDDSVYRPDQRVVTSTMDWRHPGAEDCHPQPDEENFLPNLPFSNQKSSCNPSQNQRLDASRSEQSKSGTSPRNSANKSPSKKRKRKPRAFKPRKPRTLTDEGKAHAKAVRDYPGGACEYCKRKKTKARDLLLVNLGSTH